MAITSVVMGWTIEKKYIHISKHKNTVERERDMKRVSERRGMDDIGIHDLGGYYSMGDPQAWSRITRPCERQKQGGPSKIGVGGGIQCSRRSHRSDVISPV